MKTLILASFFILFIYAFNSCGDDSTNPINPNPPAPDSTVILSTPANNTIFHFPNLYSDSVSITFTWHKKLNSPNYEVFVAKDSITSPNSCGIDILSDTTYQFTFNNCFVNLTSPAIFYYRVRIHNSTYWSETRSFTLQSP